MPSHRGTDFGFSRARTVREHYESLLARAEFKERAADLLNADEVKIADAQAKQAFVAHVLRLPALLAPQVVGESDAGFQETVPAHQIPEISADQPAATQRPAVALAYLRMAAGPEQEHFVEGFLRLFTGATPIRLNSLRFSETEWLIR